MRKTMRKAKGKPKSSLGGEHYSAIVYTLFKETTHLDTVVVKGTSLEGVRGALLTTMDNLETGFWVFFDLTGIAEANSSPGEIRIEQLLFTSGKELIIPRQNILSITTVV